METNTSRRPVSTKDERESGGSELPVVRTQTDRESADLTGDSIPSGTLVPATPEDAEKFRQIREMIAKDPEKYKDYRFYQIEAIS